MQTPTGFEGVYASGGGFEAKLQKGAKRLRQNGFRSPVEAALARARWTKSLEEGGARVTPPRQRLGRALVGLPVIQRAPGNRSSWRRRHCGGSGNGRGAGGGAADRLREKGRAHQAHEYALAGALIGYTTEWPSFIKDYPCILIFPHAVARATVFLTVTKLRSFA